MTQPDTGTVPAAQRPVNHLRLLFATLMIVMLMASLSQMIFSTALPTIVGELHGVDQMMWVITAYMLASTVTMPIYGKAGDLFGRKSMMLVAIAIALVLAALFVRTESCAEHPVIPLSLFKNRNFVLTTTAGLATAVAMFGAVGYLPTYFQMAEGVSATEAGLLMLPMMGSLLITSVVVGAVVSRTGRYKVLPIAGSLILVLGLWLLSTITVETPLVMICLYMGVMGIGLGSSMQILTLIVQNEFPHRLVGTATAANNYFRQVGSSLGSAVVGSLFVARLTTLLAERLPAAAGAADITTSLTPELIGSLPEPIRQIIVGSYNDALVPIFVFMVPLGLLAALVLAFVKETPLATEIKHEITAESLADGQVLITEFDDDDDADLTPAVGRPAGR